MNTRQPVTRIVTREIMIEPVRRPRIDWTRRLYRIEAPINIPRRITAATNMLATNPKGFSSVGRSSLRQSAAAPKNKKDDIAKEATALANTRRDIIESRMELAKASRRPNMEINGTRLSNNHDMGNQDKELCPRKSQSEKNPWAAQFAIRLDRIATEIPIDSFSTGIGSENPCDSESVECLVPPAKTRAPAAEPATSQSHIKEK
jgi:hypothetical protein